ncbi:MAG: methionine biosynthesis protein MetW [Dokdonella sp.]|uniref:methionine biosynthesis protein MetW n=1 Tax=Dokdonella sp. TaxID=2291710 RepID=UPI0032638B66
MNASEQDDYLERIKDEIRAEADVARHRDPLPRADPPARSIPEAKSASAGVPIERERLDYALSDLTGIHYIAFVDNAFRALLKREPDEGGSHAQIRLLASGASKAEILGNLRWSREGKHVGARVHGLLPRYAIAKLARVPVLGYLVEWAIAFAGLAVMLRHQRAADTSTAAGFHAARDTQARAESELRGLHSALGSEHAALVAGHAGLVAQHADSLVRQQALNDAHDRRTEQLTIDLRVAREQADVMRDHTHALDQRLHASSDELVQLRHLVHTVNHWLVSLQRSLDDLESAEAASSERTDALAALVDEGPDAAAARNERYRNWSSALMQRLPAESSVLDLASGDGLWLDLLMSHGLDASGIEANVALVERTRAGGAAISVGDAMTALARCNDASLDGITLGRAALPDDRSGIDRLTREIGRVLKPGGLLLARIESEPFRIEPQGASIMDARRWSAVFAAAGFAPAQVLPADGGIAVLTTRP